MAILEIKDMCLSFGGLKVIDTLNFNIERNSISSLIGPNGAGKTSIFNCMTGFYKPSEGDILFNGESILKKKPHTITQRGIARTFQNMRLFRNMTVLENVMSGMHCRSSAGFWGAVLHSPWQKKEEKRILEFCEECLDFVGILDKKDWMATNLPYGGQRRIEWARALATQPKLLLLDEPAAGLNYDEKEQLIKLIHKIREERNITVFLIEHDMGLIMKVSEHITVIDYGKKIAEGNADTIKNDPKVIEAYLGKDEEEAA